MATITEDYCSFEVAKLLKEKGFSENTICKYADIRGITEKWYDDYRERVLHFDLEEGYLIEPSIEPKDQYEIIGDTIAAPTIQMAMKWLRKVYNIDICAFPYQADYILYSYNVKIYKDKEIYLTITDSKTYEEACEAAIKYCLENLI